MPYLFPVTKTTSLGYHWHGHAERISHPDLTDCYRETGHWRSPDGRHYPATSLLGFDPTGCLVLQTPFTRHRYVQGCYTCGRDTYTVAITLLPNCRHFHFTTHGPAKADWQKVWYHLDQQGASS